MKPINVVPTWLKIVTALAFLFYFVLFLSSCRTSRNEPAAEPRGVAPVAAVPVAADGGAPGGKVPGKVDSYRGNVDSSRPKQGELTPPAPDAPRWQHRQYRRNVRAAKAPVPKKIGKGAAYAPAATTVATGYKASAPVVAADSGSRVQVATAAKGAQAAAGEGIVQEKVEPAGKPWQAYVFGPVGIALAVLLVAGVAYGVWQYRRARSIV